MERYQVYNKIPYLFLIGIIFSFSNCNTSKNSINTIKDSNIKDFEVDDLGNLYIINKDNLIEKYDPANKLHYDYGNYQAGELSSLDVSNPHKILLFYKDYQQIIILDNTLSEISTIQLNPELLIVAIGYANDGNIWLYDSSQNKFLKINNKGEIVNESFITKEISGGGISGNKIYDQDNYLFVIEDDKKLILYDNQTYYLRTIPFASISKPIVLNDIIYYFDKSQNKIMSYNLRYNENEAIYDFTKDDIKVKSAIIRPERIYFITGDKNVKKHKRFNTETQVYVIDL